MMMTGIQGIAWKKGNYELIRFDGEQKNKTIHIRVMPGNQKKNYRPGN